jgi:hypothetical protein
MGASTKFKNWPRPLFSPRTDHACHKKPNPFRETVPLRIYSSKYLLVTFKYPENSWNTKYFYLAGKRRKCCMIDCPCKYLAPINK